MTNHGESTGSPENGKAAGRDGQGADDERLVRPAAAEHPVRPGAAEHPAHPAAAEHPVRPGRADCTAYDSHGAEHQVTLRSPAELADALPYLLGYRPEDSIVLVALHDRDGRGRFGGRARLGIPAGADDWDSVAGQLAHGLVTGSERRGARPEQMVAYLCQEPGKGESGRQVMERLRPLAQKLRIECGLLDVPVIEALCISDGRFWSYCCSNEACCPPEGQSMGLPGTSVLAAAATYAGLQVRGTLRELRARLQPWETAAALEQESALDAASAALVPRILEDASRVGVAEETLELAALIMRRLAEAPPVSSPLAADLRDDELLAHDEAATLILGLQDRVTRDRAAEWMEGDEAPSALRLWRALARRCVGPYGEHAAAPLTLAGWVAWSTGDDLEAREALAMALGSDPDYLFARLLHQACNEGLDPESIRRCLRAERRDRGSGEVQQGPEGEEGAIAEPGVAEVAELQVSEQAESAVAEGVGLESTQNPMQNPTQNLTQNPMQNQVQGSVPGSAARSRRRARQGSTLHGNARSAKAEAKAGGRGSGTGVPHQRKSASTNTRPSSARTGHSHPRTSGKSSARRRDGRSGNLHPGGDGAGGEL